jgi:serine/threonine protein kinase
MEEKRQLLSGVLLMTEQSPAEAIFFTALEKGTPEERAAYLDAACGDESDLRRRVERLLEAHPKAGDFLEPPAARPTAAYVSGREEAGAIIAERFKLLEQIGEGGMGVVWVADQLEPVRRRVALKLIKPGMDSRAVLARFEAERQALALMDHPNIAKVLDAGTTADGRPFFVMELVKGTPITEFCDARKLTARERLELFVPVCQAVQHAHQKGIIHRDLKPGNVLVALHDEQPVPKVIDFGVAKAIGQQLTEKTIYTGFGALVGTPAYMAPEQAAFNALDVDTRADVYALGVLLYELLVGSPPFEPDRIKTAALDEILRLVREEEPPRPSNRLSTSQARASIAAVRQSDPERLTKLMRGELDWIVMKALEKDRNRRYETANGFAADLQRYLAGEAVHAHPPSTAYRLRKFMRKHRAMLTTAAAFAGLLLAAAAVSSWLAVEARRAAKVANEHSEEANRQRQDAIDQSDVAMRTKFALYGHLVNLVSKNQEVERLNNNLKVDADLAQLENEPKVGLLQLCQTLKGLPGKHVESPTFIIPGSRIGETEEYNTGWGEDDPRRQELREFVTAAILANGQNYAPLLPPITHDGQKVLHQELSPDFRTLLTLGEDGTCRLWDVRTAKQFAILGQANERVMSAGFSPDGQTVCTDDLDGIVRFWNCPAGTYRTQTEPRKDRYEDPALRGPGVCVLRTFALAGKRLLTSGMPANSFDSGGHWASVNLKGPIELWDTASGRLVGRLDGQGRDIGDFRLLGSGLWVAAIENPSTALVFSAEDGRLAGRLSHPAGEIVKQVVASPSGRKVVTLAGGEGKTRLRFWDTQTWQADFLLSDDDAEYVHFWSDELLAVEFGGFFGRSWTIDRVYRLGQPPSSFPIPGFCRPLLPSGNFVLTDGGQVIDTHTGERLRPSPDRKFHPTLAQFAADGRFVVAGGECLDTVTEKSFQISGSWTDYDHAAGAGFVSLVFNTSSTGSLPENSGGVAQVKLVPTAAIKDIPADLLELWAQVACRGELGPDGTLVKWDEPTWERKRQELAAKPAPRPDVPFPGFVATDRLHWLRQEYAIASEADKPILAKRMLDRAEAAGDNAEATRWRAIAGSKANPTQK